MRPAGLFSFLGALMEYVLITTKGKRFYFHVRECAEVYKVIHGGEIFLLDKETGVIRWRNENVRVKYG